MRRDYDRIRNQVRSSMVAFGFEESTVPAMAGRAGEAADDEIAAVAEWYRS